MSSQLPLYCTALHQPQRISTFEITCCVNLTLLLRPPVIFFLECETGNLTGNFIGMALYCCLGCIAGVIIIQGFIQGDFPPFKNPPPPPLNQHSNKVTIVAAKWYASVQKHPKNIGNRLGGWRGGPMSSFSFQKSCVIGCLLNAETRGITMPHQPAKRRYTWPSCKTFSKKKLLVVLVYVVIGFFLFMYLNDYF